MSEYLVLIYQDEAALGGLSEAAMGKMMEGHTVFMERNQASLRGGNALERATTATSLRKNAAGELVVTDGAFAETKEALGGYYLIEAADLDEAISIASQIPSDAGGVEVRPIRVFD